MVGENSEPIFLRSFSKIFYILGKTDEPYKEHIKELMNDIPDEMIDLYVNKYNFLYIFGSTTFRITSLSIATFSIMTLSNKDLFVTLIFSIITFIIMALYRVPIC